jgi:hypothetical protein
MLTQPQVAPYLLQRSLITQQAIVRGDLEVHSLASRNNNFKAVSVGGPSYLLKQGVGAEREATVAREAAVYGLLYADAGAARLRRYLPGVCLYSPEDSVLVLELFSDAQSMGEYHLRRGRFSTSVAGELGRALGTLHRVTTAEDGRAEAGGYAAFPMPAPFALSIHRPHTAFFNEASHANLQLVKIVQRFPEYCALLDDLRKAWHAGAFVHYDIKWNNLLVLPPGARESHGVLGNPRLRIIDWELAGMGDPCWDAGSVFSEYLNFWLNSIPITGEDPPDRFVELARYPLGKMQPALRSFWWSYASAMELDGPTAYEWLVRSVRYGAARLVQTAFEYAQGSMHLTGNVVCALQLSLNMLQRPQEAAVHLLGIPLWGREAA